jgi:hypothetical protein
MYPGVHFFAILRYALDLGGEEGIVLLQKDYHIHSILVSYDVPLLQGRVPPHIGSALDSIRTFHCQAKDRIRRLTNMLIVFLLICVLMFDVDRSPLGSRNL